MVEEHNVHLFAGRIPLKNSIRISQIFPESLIEIPSLD